MKKSISGIVFVLLTLCFANAQSKHPNIIWLVSEDQSPEFFPMYGDNTVYLPHLEALAADSVIYDNMHATTPVCAPARSAIITGMYPTTLGTFCTAHVSESTMADGSDGSRGERGSPDEKCARTGAKRFLPAN